MTTIELPDGVPDMHDRVVTLGSFWGWPVFVGVASLIVGIIALVWPGATLAVLAVLFGIQLVLHGIFRLVVSFTLSEATGGARALLAVLGILSLLVGIYAIRHVVITIVVLGLVLGIFWILDGVALIFSALEQRDSPVRGLLGLGGALAVVLGIILVAWPQISLAVLAVVAGIWLIIHGVLLVAIGLKLRKAAKIVTAASTAI